MFLWLSLVDQSVVGCGALSGGWGEDRYGGGGGDGYGDQMPPPSRGPPPGPRWDAGPNDGYGRAWRLLYHPRRPKRVDSRYEGLNVT